MAALEQKRSTVTVFNMVQTPTTRRFLIAAASPLMPQLIGIPAEARERRNRKTIPLEDHLTTSFDVWMYYKLSLEKKGSVIFSPNGLFSAQAAPKPPPIMYSTTQGMRVGGKRTVIVSPESGYGQKGMNEILPGATFELNLELLQVMQPDGK